MRRHVVGWVVHFWFFTTNPVQSPDLTPLWAIFKISLQVYGNFWNSQNDRTNYKNKMRHECKFSFLSLFFNPCIQVRFNVCLTFLRTVQKIHISLSLSYFQSKTKWMTLVMMLIFFFYSSPLFCLCSHHKSIWIPLNPAPHHHLPNDWLVCCWYL